MAYRSYRSYKSYRSYRSYKSYKSYRSYRSYKSYTSYYLLLFFQKNFICSPFSSLRSMLARRDVPRRNHLLVSHFSPSTSFTIV